MQKRKFCVCVTPLIPEIKNLLHIHIILYYVILYHIRPCSLFLSYFIKCDFFIVIYLLVLFKIQNVYLNIYNIYRIQKKYSYFFLFGMA